VEFKEHLVEQRMRARQRVAGVRIKDVELVGEIALDDRDSAKGTVIADAITGDRVDCIGGPPGRIAYVADRNPANPHEPDLVTVAVSRLADNRLNVSIEDVAPGRYEVRAGRRALP